MKQIKLKVYALCIGIFLSFLIGELTARIYFFGWTTFSYSKINSFGRLDNSNLLKYSEIDGLPYELKPNLDTKYKLVDFRTNREGFRDANHEVKAKIAHRIAVIGDSFTMGTGVAEKSTYTRKTEYLFNENNTKNNYEFLNFGVSGFTLDQYVTNLENNVLAYDADVVVLGFCASNDQLVIDKDFSLDKFTIKPKKHVFWDSYLKKFIKIKLGLKASSRYPIVYEPHQIDFMYSQFERLQNVLTKNEAKGIIFYLDLVYDSARIEQIKELAAQNNLLFLDASIAFKDKNLNKYIVNELDPHPNDLANSLFAEYLHQFMLSNENVLFSN